MGTSDASVYSLDPSHISCIGGRTVVTCPHCAGNAPRGAICGTCSGRGFNIFVCPHCNPAGTATVARSIGTSSATANTTPGSSAPSSPGSLSRSSSTSFPSHLEPRTDRASSWRILGNNGDASCGRVESNTPRSL